MKMNHGYTPPRPHRRHSRLGEKIVAAMLSASLVTSFLPASALAAPADANGSVPGSSVDAGSLPVEDIPEIDTRETTIAPETLPTSGASSLASYGEDEGFSLADMFSARSDEPRDGELPTEVAGTKIESLRATWRTPDDVTDNDAARLSLVPEDASQKTVQLSLEAALSGQFDYDPGDISFTIPKTFLAYRDGSPAGTMKLSVPQSPSTSGMFAYVDNGDTYSVVNTKTLPAATSVLLQLEVNSIDVTRMKGDESDSGRFWCDLIVKGGESGEELVGMTNNALFATFKTNTTVKSATDTVQNLYDKYPSSFPAELKPENDGDYIYIDWYSYAHIEGNQYFDVSATASLSGFSGGTVLGMKDNTGKIHAAPAGASSFTAEIAKSAYQTGQGYYLHTYAAYPRSGLKNDVTSTFSHDISYALTTVDTKAASSARAAAQKSYTPKEWETPVGHFGMGKRGYNTYHLALNDLVKGEDQFAYFDLKTLGFGAPFTTDKYYGTNDKIPPEELGKKSYKLVTDDYDTWFNNSTTPLTSENFEFSSMKVDKPVMYDYRLFDADGRGWTENAEGSIAETTVPAGSYGYKATDDMSNQPLIVIEGSVNGSSAYTKFGEIQWKADGTVYTKGFNGASWSGTTLTFPANVTDTRQTAETCGHGIVYMVHPTVKIKANAATIAQARSLFDNSDSPSTYVRNEAKAHALVRQYHYEGQVLVEGWRSTDDVVQGGDDTLRGAASGVSLSAETTVREPSTSGNPTKDYLFNYIVQLNNQSNITDLGAYNEAVEQGYISQEMSGSWFCLLPPGVHYYKASYVGKRSGDRIVNQTVVENWRGSGRDMLIVDMSQTPAPRYYMATDYLMGKSGYADRPYISFLASMSVEDVEEFGCDTRLVAAYQSNNDEIGTVKGFRGEPNEPMFGNHHESAEAVGTYAAEMTGLSSSYPHNENGAFVYARDRSPISVNRSGVTGLQKYVSVDGGTTWTNGQGDNEANVYGGQEYSYRLRNGATDDEKNVVIYDQLECAKDLGLAGTDATDATWRGKLESVDVSRMVAAGVSPVVYYSTVEGLDIDGSASDRNLSNASIWSTTPPDDMSKVTAVAIDASKSRDGSDFVLKSGRSLTATVNMRAPLVTELIAKAKSEGTETTGSDWYDSTVGNTQADEEGFKGGAHALNGTTRTSTIVGGTNQKTTTSYTKVGLKPFKVELSKSWDDDSNHDGYRPASVDVDIFGNGTLAKTVTLTDEGATGDAWNKLVVDDLPYLDAAGGKISYTFAERMGDVASANYKSSIDDNEAQDAKGAVLSVAMTNTHTLDPVSAHVEKIWSDGAEGIDDYDKIRPDSVTVKICRDAGNTRYTVRTLVLSAENNWSADVNDLPQLYQGQPVSYSVWEQVPSGYRYSYTIDGASNKSVTVGPDKKHFDVAITNVHVPETRTFTFNKVWNDGNNHDKKRPGEVFVDVYANGNKLEGATVRLSADNGWTATTGSLYKNDGAGNEISYTFKERGENIYEAGSTTVEQMSQGYTSAVDMSRYAAGKIEIENTHRILMSTFPIAKHWGDSGNEAGARPESVVIDVYANGKFFRQEVLTGPATAGTWEEHVSYEDLDASGNPIVYTFKEHEPVPGYYCVQEDEEIPEMTNVYYPYGNIAIEKTVENATDVSSATDFSFKVEVTHEDGTPDAGTYAWTSSDGRTGTVENGGTVSIKGGQSVTIEKVPSECSYRIEELYAPGWRATGDGYVRTGKIVPRSDNKASFANMYSATGRVNFSASKNVEGTDLRSSQFVFELNRVADDGSRTLVGTAYNASGGQVSFGSEPYSLQDVGKTFHYQISERDTGRAGYAYDGSVFDAYVKVVDDGDGSLSGQVTYSKGGEQVDVPTFTNVYSASGTVSPSAHKVLKGQDLKDGMFSFKLIDKATGEQVGNLATNDVDGNIAFGAISYDESDAGHTYYYEMSEIAGDDETVIYSTETYLYEVKVRDNRNGTLSFDTRTYKPYAAPEEGDGSGNVPAEDVVEIDGAQYVEAQPVFTNDSVPGTLVLEKKVDGVAGQDYDPSAEFTFHVTLNSPGDYEFNREEKTDAWAVYTDDDKTMRFVRASSEDKAKARVAEVRGTELPSEADSMKAWTGFEETAADTTLGYIANSNEITPGWNMNQDGTFSSSSVEKIDFVDPVHPKTIYNWFAYYTNLKTVTNEQNLDTSQATCISSLFSGCSSLEQFDASQMDVSNCEIIQWVFDCSGIKTLDLSTWDTRKATTIMSICGVGSNSFSTVDCLERFTIGENLVLPDNGMSTMNNAAFGSKLYKSSLDEKVYAMRLPVTGDTSKEQVGIPAGQNVTYYRPAGASYFVITDVNHMYISHFEANNVPQVNEQYHNETVTNVIDYNKAWQITDEEKNKIEKVTFEDTLYEDNMRSAFSSYKSVKMFEGLSNIEFACNTDVALEAFFQDCVSLEFADVPFDVEQKVSLSGLFSGCSSLKTVSFSGSLTTDDLSDIFAECSTLTDLDLHNVHGQTTYTNTLLATPITNVLYMAGAFSNCSSLRSLDLSPIGDNMETIVSFSGCSSLETLNVNNINFTARSMGNLFAGLDSLYKITVNDTITTPIDTYKDPFFGEEQYYFPAGTWVAQSDGTEYTEKTIPSGKADTYVRKMPQLYGILSEVSSQSRTLTFDRMIDAPEIGSLYNNKTVLEIYTADQIELNTGNPPWYTKRYYIDTVEIKTDIHPISTKSWFYDTKINSIDNLEYIDMSNVINASNMFYGKIKSIVGYEKWDMTKVENISQMFFGTDLTALDLSNWNLNNVTQATNLFYRSSKLEYVNLSNLNMNKLTSLDWWFYDCSSLREILFENFSATSVKSFYQMFCECTSLQRIDMSTVPKFPSLGDMSGMFYGCRELSYLDISCFRSLYAKSRNPIFNNTPKLSTVVLANCSISDAFNGTSYAELPTISSEDVPGADGYWYNLDTGKKYTAYKMASVSTKELIGGTWVAVPPDTTNASTVSLFPDFLNPPVTNASEVGEDASHSSENEALKSAKGIPIGSPFVGEQQRNLVVEQGRTANNGAGLLMGTNSSAVMADQAVMFATGDIASGTSGTCTWVIASNNTLTIKPTSGTSGTLGNWTDISPWAESKANWINNVKFSNIVYAKTCKKMFYNCKSISSIDFTGLNTKDVFDMSEMLYECNGLSSLNVSSLNVSNVRNMSGTFRGCTNLKQLDLQKWNTQNVTDMSRMFNRCLNLATLNIATLKTYNVTNMESMFSYCYALKSINLSSFDTRKVTDMSNMFNTCRGLLSLNVNNFNTSNVIDMGGMFDYCSELTSLNLSNFDTRKVTDMTSMFRNCSKLTSVNLESFVTSNVVQMSYMFQQCRSLKSMDLKNFDTRKATSMSYMFYNCSSLSRLTISENFVISSYTYSAGFLPEPDERYVSYAVSGKWISNDAKTKGPYTPDQLSEALKNSDVASRSLAGTWQWEEQLYYALSFNANEGVGNISNMENIGLGNIVTLPSYGIYKFGKILSSWNTAPDGSGTSYPVNEPIVIDGVEADSTLTLYAQWADEDTSIDASTGSFDVILHPNEIVTIPNVPAGTTYTVTEKTPAGWNIVSEGTVGMNGTITTNKTSTASVKNEYTTDKTVANIQAMKKLDGVTPKYDASNESAGDIDGKFAFELFPADSSGNVTGDAIGAIKHNNLSGAVTFDPMEYTTVTNKADGDDYYYVIREQKNLPDIYDYASDVIVNVKVTDDGEGHLASTVTYNGSDEVPVMSNTSKPGSLTVSKQYGLPKSADGNQHPDTAFEFSIDLLYPDGTSETRAMQLACGEEQTIGNLPAGTTYTVTESNLPAGWKNTLSEGATGTIEAGSTSAVHFKNIYETRPTSVVLTATKSMSDGSVMEDGKYAFDLYEIASDATEVPADATPVQQAHSTENGDISFDMLTFTTPGAHRFAIKENLDNMDATVDYDTHAEFVDVTVTDNGEGSLAAQVSYDDDGAKFVNSHKAAHLKVSKTAIGVSDMFTGRSYAFDVVLRDASGNLLDGAYSYKVYEQGGTTGADEGSVEGDAGAASDIEVASGTVSANGTIELKSGQYAVIDLPVNTSYEIAEKTPSGFVCDAQGNIGAISVDDATRTIEATFTNTYFANGTVKLTASKEARGFELADNQFSFALTDEDGNMVSTAKNSLDGVIEFPPVAYTASDIGKTFVYNISEVNDGQCNIAYDNGSYSAVVTVSDNGDGTLSTDTVIVKGDVKYTEDGSIDYSSMETVAAGENVFVNSYSLAMPFSGETGAPVLAILGLLLTIAGVLAIRRRNATDGQERAENKNMSI